MSATIHKHHWQQFREYDAASWRCTTAPTKAQLEHVCEDECNWRYHYVEEGCLGTLVRWRKQGNYFFCAPGARMVELKNKPKRMIIDDEYLEQAASIEASLRQLVAA